MKLIDVIQAGIDLGGGDYSLTPLIKRCLNAWIKHEVTLYPFIRTYTRTPSESSPNSTLSAGTTSISLPTNYYQIESICLIDPSDNQQLYPLRILDNADRDNLVVDKTQQGQPQYAHIDHSESKLYLFPPPDKTYEYYFRYKKLPDEIEVSGDDDDQLEANEANTGYPDPLVLMKVCQFFTLNWRRNGQEASMIWQEIEKLKIEVKRTALDNRRGYRKSMLSSQFFRTKPYV